MKKFLVVFLFCGMLINLHSQSGFCLRMSELSNDGETLVVRIEMQGDSPFALGSSNLQFSYSEANLGEPTLVGTLLGPPIYFDPTLTTPDPGQASLNVELAFPGTGLIVVAEPDYSPIADISFPILGSEVGELTWTYNGGTTATVVFSDDEATQLFATDSSCLIGLVTPIGSDQCEGATPIGAGDYTDLGPSTGGGAALGCYPEGANNSSWYLYTAAESGTAVITSNFDPALTDTRLSVYTGDCGSLFCYAQDDDSGEGFTSELILDIVAGDSYYIEWDDRWTSNGFEWSVFENPEIPPCSSLLNPTEGESVVLNEVGNNSVLLTWESPSDLDQATEVKIYIGTDPNELDLVETFPYGVTQYSFENAEFAETYYWTIVPSNYDIEAVDCEIRSFDTAFMIGDTDGDGVLDADDCAPADPLVYLDAPCDDMDPTTLIDMILEDCTCEGVIAEAGELCQVAKEAFTDVIISDSIVVNLMGASNACFISGGTNALWYYWTSPSNGEAMVSSSIDLSLPDTRLSIYTGSCDSLVCVANDDDGGEGFTSIANFIATEGETYFIEWDDRWENEPFSFEVTLDTEAELPPSNDNCDGAPISVLTSDGTPVVTMGNTLNATPSISNVIAPVVWEAFTISECSDVHLTMCGTPVFVNGYLQGLYDCPSLDLNPNFGQIVDSECEEQIWDLVWSGLAPGTYHYPIRSGDVGIDGPYSLKWTATPSEDCFPIVDCPDLGLNFGDPCDDGDDATLNDLVTENCDCMGIVSPISNCGQFSSSPNGLIPDAFDSLAYLDTIVVVGEFNLLENMRVAIQLDHTYLGDMDIKVTSPSGTIVSLIEYPNNCGTNDDLNVIFEDGGQAQICTTPFIAIIDPSEPLGVFAGESFVGGWVLTITDNLAGDIGTLIQWCLLPEFEEFNCPELSLNIGDACDDGNPDSMDDIVSDDCVCQGEICNVEAAIISTQSETVFCSDDGTSHSVAVDVEGGLGEFESLAITNDTGDVFVILPILEVNFESILTGQYYIYHLFSSEPINNFNGNLFDVEGCVAISNPIIVDVTFGADCTDCPELNLNVGSQCEDGDGDLIPGIVTPECICEEIVLDCPELLSNFGDDCDDGLTETINDMVNEDCVCAGVDIPSTMCGQYSSMPEIFIPDGPNTTVLDTLNVDGIFNPLISMSVAVQIDHTFLGDLEILLTSPAGTVVTLFPFPNTCNGQQNMNVLFQDGGGIIECTTPFMDVIDPVTPLSDLEDEQFSGDWVLSVSDNWAFDTGSLIQWCLIPEFGEFGCPELGLNIGDECDDGNDDLIPGIVSEDCICEMQMIVEGCTDIGACNYDPSAVVDDFSCEYPLYYIPEVVFSGPVVLACSPPANYFLADQDCIEEVVLLDPICLEDFYDPVCAFAYNSCIGLDCPGLGSNIGDSCSDLDNSTVNDMVDENCNCVGTCPTIPAVLTTESTTVLCLDDDTPDLITFSIDTIAGIGAFMVIVDENDDVVQLSVFLDNVDFSSLADGLYRAFYITYFSIQSSDDNGSLGGYSGCYSLSNPIEITIVSGADCPPIFDCPMLSLNIGDTCDDGDANTLNDSVNENCLCAGIDPCPNPLNDEMSGALSNQADRLWGVPGWDTFDVTCATLSDETCDGSSPLADSWYSFVAQAENQGVLVRPNPADVNAATADMAVEIFDASGSPLDGLTGGECPVSRSCFNHAGPGEIERCVPGGLTVGVTYYYRTYDASGGELTSVDTKVKTYAAHPILEGCEDDNELGLAGMYTIAAPNTLYNQPPVPVFNVRMVVQDLSGNVISMSAQQDPEMDGGLNFSLADFVPEIGPGSYTVHAQNEVKMMANGCISSYWSQSGPGCDLEIGPGSTEANWHEDNEEIGLAFTAYPNPNSGDQVFIKLNHGLDQDQNLLVEVFDIYGKRIHMEQIKSVGDEINRIIVFDQKLSSGMYLINLSVDDVYLTKKLIVE